MKRSITTVPLNTGPLSRSYANRVTETRAVCKITNTHVVVIYQVRLPTRSDFEQFLFWNYCLMPVTNITIPRLEDPVKSKTKSDASHRGAPWNEKGSDPDPFAFIFYGCRVDAAKTSQSASGAAVGATRGGTRCRSIGQY